MKRIVLALMLSGLGFAVQAQSADTWTVMRGAADDPGVAAVVCPVYDEAKGELFCLTLGCEPDGQMDFLLAMTRRDYPDAFELLVEVDGREAERLQFERTDFAQFPEYVSDFDRARHPALIERLKKGYTAVLSVAGSDPLLTESIGLTKSSVSLNVILSECNLPTGE